MKGIVFRLFEDFVAETWGHDTYDDLLDACPEITDTAFVAVKSYPDAWLVALVGAACARLQLPPEVAIRAFGVWSFGRLVAKYPVFLQGHAHPKPFLASVHDVVHTEVHKLLPGAGTPTLWCEDTGPDGMRVVYASPRSLCAFAEGLMAGCGAHFGVGIRVEHAACTLRGDPQCVFDLTFDRPWLRAA